MEQTRSGGLLMSTPGKPLRAILESRDSYRALDPFSEKPFLYNEARDVLYSVGPDGIDNGGMTDIYGKEDKTDIIVPCRAGRRQ